LTKIEDESLLILFFGIFLPSIEKEDRYDLLTIGELSVSSITGLLLLKISLTQLSINF
jgi:hypothetical protein